MTAGQTRALESNWAQFGLSLEQGLIDPAGIFAREAPLVLEIGYGMGGSLLQMAATEPDKDFIGIEVHPPGVGALLQGIAEEGMDNIRTYMADAQDVLWECIPPESLHRLQIYFPDPWPKKRHHKRRLIQPEFARLAADRLAHGGLLHLATDWQPYAEHMLEVLDNLDCLENQSQLSGFAERPHWRPLTKFERRGETLGHKVFDLIYKKR